MDSLAFPTIDATDATDATANATEFVLVCDVFWVDWGNRETDLLALALQWANKMECEWWMDEYEV